TSAKETEQALAALATARNVIFPVRRGPEAIQLLSRIAPMLAIAGDASGAHEVVALLPANQRDAVQIGIVTAQIGNADLPAALQVASGISAENVRSQSLLLVVQAQAAAQDFAAAMRTGALIPTSRIEFPQALIEIAKQHRQPDQRSEALQLLSRAAAIAEALPDSNSDGSPDCGLS